MKVVGGALAPLSFAFFNVTAGLIRGLAWALRMLLGSASELSAPLVSSYGLSAFLFSYLSFLSFSSLLPPPSPTTAGTWRETAGGSHGPGWGKGPPSGLGVRVLETLHDGLKETRPFPADG